MLVSIRKNLSKIFLKDFFQSFIVVIIVTIYAGFSYSNKNVISVYPKLILGVFTYYSCSRFFKYRQEAIKTILIWFCLGVAFSPFFQVNISDLKEVTNQSRLEADNLGNFNAYGFLISVSTLITLYLITQIKGGAKKLLFILVNIPALFVLFYTFSRGALFSLLFGLIIFLLSGAKKMKFTIFLTSIVVIGLLLLVFQKLDIGNALFDRFFNADDDYDSGRFIIYGILLTNLVSTVFTFLFGFGLGAINIQIFLESNIESAHSTYLDMFYSFGIVGLLILIRFLISNLIKAFRIKKPAEKSIVLAILGQCILSFFYDSYWGATQTGWLFPFLFAFFSATFPIIKTYKKVSIAS